MTQQELEKQILIKIRQAYAAGRAAPSSKRLYSWARKRGIGVYGSAVDAALSSLVAAGTIRITDGMWFEVGVRDLEAKAKQLAAKRLEKASKGQIPTKKVDNRKPSKVPRGMKLSAQARTLWLEGVK